MRTFISLCLLVGLTCLSRPLFPGESEKIMLSEVSVVSGQHCESSAILNALIYLDYDFNEAMVAGGGGGPAFVFQKQDFPFLGGRGYNLREIFFKGAEISWHSRVPEEHEDRWAAISDLLEQESLSFSEWICDIWFTGLEGRPGLPSHPSAGI
jgi:hypothetical protein